MDESYCLALTALLYYFACCDGNISAEEQAIVLSTLNSVFSVYKLSENAISEIDKIQKRRQFSFVSLRKYLVHISTEELTKLATYIDDIVSANDGISSVETEAKIKFEDYVFY